MIETLLTVMLEPMSCCDDLGTTKKSSCPSVFFLAFLQTAVIGKPIPALFVGTLQSATIGGL